MFLPEVLPTSSVDVSDCEDHRLAAVNLTLKNKAYNVYYGRLTGVFLLWYVFQLYVYVQG
jgi:hypothetical protein